jgi:two-component system, cell cycle sensor histidine kinase and response regulator CckA
VTPTENTSAIRASFQFKLFLIFTLMSFLTACAFITLHALDKVSETRDHAGKELLLRARQLADSIRLPLYAEDADILREVAQRTGQIPGICRVTIRAADGAVLADYRAPAGKDQRDTIAETVEVVSLPERISGLGEGQGGSPVRIGYVHLERETDDLKGAIHRDIGYACLIALVFWLAVSGFSFLVLRRTTRSFEALVRGVEAMRGGDYASRIPIVSGDEPGRVAGAINALAETLQQRDQENLDLTEELLTSFKTEVRAREELISVNRSLKQENLERLQAEQAARQSEQTLKTLMDIMPVGVVLARQDGSVEYVNQFLVDSFGYGREEIATLDAWFSKMKVQREVLTRSRDAAGPDAKPYDARVTCKGGPVRHVLLSSQIQGERTILLVIDITDRELIQEQLNKVQKLESLGVLAGGIAHNFNNALTGVLGFISLSRCTLDTSHGAHRYLQLAEKASLRAAGMAKQLLTFAKGGAPVKRSIPLAKLVDEVMSLTLNGSNVRCDVELPAELPPVRADEGQMVQALSNIVINAMQAMPGGGVITVRAHTEAGSPPDAGHDGVSYVCLSITDQGHGIAAENLPKIFDPYFSTKETTGLGLASVHSIVYRHGGHVSVSSQVGRGTTFTISLPAAKGALPGADDRGSDSRQCAPGGAVLVMDDDPGIRELSAKMLGFLGYQSIACADGREAVELYRSRREGGEPFRAAILDLTVPGGMGGVEAAREILACDPQANLIVSSGYSYDPVMAQYRKYGFCGAVGKPYRADELSQELGMLR